MPKRNKSSAGQQAPNQPVDEKKTVAGPKDDNREELKKGSVHEPASTDNQRPAGNRDAASEEERDELKNNWRDAMNDDSIMVPGKDPKKK